MIESSGSPAASLGLLWKRHASRSSDPDVESLACVVFGLHNVGFLLMGSQGVLDNRIERA